MIDLILNLKSFILNCDFIGLTNQNIFYFLFLFGSFYLSFLKNQVLTDKTSKLFQNNIYVFDVDKKLNKFQLKNLIEDIFGVKVVYVNTYIRSGKVRRLGKFKGLKNCYKRVFVKLADDNIIPYFSSL